MMPFSLAGLLRLAFGTVSHQSNVRIGLAPSTNVVSLSLVRCSPLTTHIVWHMS